MRYIKEYKIFESSNISDIIGDVKDILLDLEDMGYGVDVKLGSRYSLDITIKSKMSSDGTYITTFTKDSLAEITDSISRLYDYMKIEQTEFSRIPRSVHISKNNGMYKLISWTSLDSKYSDCTNPVIINWVSTFNKIEMSFFKFNKKDK